MQDLKQMAALTALNNMLAEGHFSICTLDKVGKLLGIKPAGDAYNILSSVHCIDYAKMPAELRDAIPDLIQQCLGVAPVYQFKTLDKRVIEVSTPEKKGVLHRLGLA